MMVVIQFNLYFSSPLNIIKGGNEIVYFGWKNNPEEVNGKAQAKGLKMLRVVLIIFAVVTIVYGIGILFLPQSFVNMSNSSPVDLRWLRWSGGVIIGLGVGTQLVFRDPHKQDIFVFTIALAGLLSGLGMLFSWVMQEYSGATWFMALPTILVLILSVLLWLSRGIAKDTLKTG